MRKPVGTSTRPPGSSTSRQPVSVTAGRIASETSTPPAGAGLAAQTTTYTYDGTDAAGNVERRSLLTKQTVTRPGTGGALTWTAAYDAAGALERQDMPGKIVLSAWSNQLSVDSADDPRIKGFIKEYRQGEQTPEPGAACTGGVTPETSLVK